MLKEFNLNYIINNQYKYLYIRKKPIYDINTGKNEKLKILDIITNMPFEEIKKFDGDRTIIKNMEDHLLLIERDVYYNFYYIDYTDNSQILNKELFNWQNFTIDMIYETDELKFLDYEYKYRNKKVQAIKDAEFSQIRLLNITRNSLIEMPSKIIQAFAYMSEFNFEIESQTLSCISKNIDVLKDVNVLEIKQYIKDILYGKNVNNTIALMKQIGVFDIILSNDNVEFLNVFSNMDFSTLETINKGRHLNWIETLTILFKDNKDNLLNLFNLGLVDQFEYDKICWLINEFDMINSTDYRESIFKSARKGIVKEKGLMQMKELLINLTNIYNKIYIDRKEEIKKIMFDFCCRPYFHNQIKIEDEIFIEISNDNDEYLLYNSKEKLLYKLVKSERFPKEMQDYMNYVSESVEEAVNEKMMAELGLL